VAQPQQLRGSGEVFSIEFPVEHGSEARNRPATVVTRALDVAKNAPLRRLLADSAEASRDAEAMHRLGQRHRRRIPARHQRMNILFMSLPLEQVPQDEVIEAWFSPVCHFQFPSSGHQQMSANCGSVHLEPHLSKLQCVALLTAMANGSMRVPISIWSV